nr:DUF1194 domain-containing protein [Rhodothalassium salexigens]
MSAPAAAALVPVDLELSLAIDVSSSIRRQEYRLQMAGYADAFRQQSVIDDIVGSKNGIAVNAVFFSSIASEGIGYQHLQTESDVLGFADLLEAFARPFNGGTDVALGMQAALDSILNNEFEGSTKIIDVSGDGTGGTGRTSRAVRDAALAQEIDAINAIAIGTEFLAAAFAYDVAGGKDAFVKRANSFDDFAEAIAKKIDLEVDQGTKPIPVPATILLMAIGLAGLGVLRRRR